MAIDFVISIMIMGGWFLSQTILEGKLLWSMRKENLSKLRYLQALFIVINTVKMEE